MTNYATRGNMRVGMQIAKHPELLDDAINTYRTEVRSRGDNSDAYVKAWADFHSQVNWVRLGVPEPCPVVPLTPKTI